MMIPSADSSYTITPDTDIGKHWGIKQPVQLKPEQYLKAYQDFAGAQQIQQDTTAQQALLDTQRKNARAWLTQRFSPGFSQQLYGKSDPTATMESQLLADQIEAAPSSKDLEGVMDKARNFRTVWETHEAKRMDLKNQLDIRAAETATKGDPHYLSTVISQNNALNELERPIQSEWETGQNILGYANARNPQADALLITALMPYVTGVKRFNRAEIENAQGGATAWGKLQNYPNQFATNPGAARINEPQRQQILSIISNKQANLKGSLAKINDARDQLTDVSTSGDVLKISAKLHRDLSTVQATPAPAGEADWIVQNGQVIRNPRKARQ